MVSIATPNTRFKQKYETNVLFCQARATERAPAAGLEYDPAVASDEMLQRRRWVVLSASVFSFFAIGSTFFVVPPLIPELITRFGLSNFRIGVLMGSISVPAVFFAIIVGLAVDRWPPRRVGAVSLTVMLAGAVTFALAPTFGVLVAGRLVFGIGGLVVNLLLARLLTVAFSGRELALAMGVFMATYPASMITVFSLHPALFSALGWRNELLLLAGLVALAIPLFLVAVGRDPAPGTTSGSRPALLPRSPVVPRPLAILAVVWLLFFAVHSSVLTFAPSWAGADVRALLIVTLVMWVAMIGSPAVGTLIDRTARPHRWAVAGLAVQGITLAGMASGRLDPSPAMLGIGAAAALVPTAVYALPGRLVEAHRVGFAFGFITSFSNLGTLTGPALSGRILDVTGDWTPVWAMLAAAAAIGAIAAAGVRHRA
jgi:predicted MFS family arabinose efflux permease